MKYCLFCGAQMELCFVRLGGVSREILVCPKDYVIKHPPVVWVPLPVSSKATRDCALGEGPEGQAVNP